MSIIPSKDCCPIWNIFKWEIKWFHLEDEPYINAMPYFTPDDAVIKKVRINNCPGCGAEVRDFLWDTREGDNRTFDPEKIQKGMPKL